MGSFFNMKVVTGVSYEKLSEYKNSGFQLIGGALGDNTIDYRSADMKKPTIIIVGNEANGCVNALKFRFWGKPNR